jgi:hypothetical protein
MTESPHDKEIMRVAVLRGHGIIGSAPEPGYDDEIAELAA